MKTDQLTNGCEELKSLFLQGIESLKKAGDKLVEMLEAGADLPSIADNTGLPADVLAQLERIGRNQLNPSLLLANYPAAVALQRLSVSEQNRLLSEPVEVLLLKGGDTHTLRVEAKNMTREQVTQVFAKGHVRALPEQRAWLASRTAVASEVKVSPPPYTVTRKKTVIFNVAVEMTTEELTKLVQTLQS